MPAKPRKTYAFLFVVLLLSSLALVPISIQAQDDTTAAITVQFNGHSFTLPRTLADGFSAFVVDEATAYLENNSLQPPRTEFRLEAYTTEVGTPAVGWVNVYDVSDLEGFAAQQQYERLSDLLNDHPDLSEQETLPTLYPYQRSALPPDRYHEFFVNASYLETEGYQGITFIYGRAIHVGNNQPVLFYRVYFEGISADGERYLSAQVEALPDLTDPLDEVTDPDDYFAQAQAFFDDPTDEKIVAWLEQANLLFSSFGYADES